VWVEPVLLDDTPGEVGHGEATPAQTDDGRSPALQDAGADVGRELAQPGVARADHGQVRERLLHPAGDAQHPGHALQRMFLGDVAAGGGLVVGAAVMRVVVGVGDGDVEQLQSDALQLTHQLEGFGQVGPGVVIFVHAEAIGVGDGVVGVQPTAQKEPGHLVLDPLGDGAEEACAVFETSAEIAVLAGKGSVQLGDEVAVAALDVDPVEPGPQGKAGRPDVDVYKAVKLVVGDEGIIGRQVVPGVKHLGVMRDDGPGGPVGLRVPPRVGKLDDEEGVVVGAHLPAGRPPGLLDQSGEVIEGAVMEPELSGVGPALGHHGSGLEPEEPGPAAGETSVAAVGEFVGTTVGSTVTAFHRVDGHGVGGGPVPDGDGLLERREVGGDGEVDPQLAGPVQKLLKGAETELLVLAGCHVCVLGSTGG